MRRMSVWVTLVGVLSLLAMPAAARPEVSPPEPVEFTDLFDAGFPCDFPLEANLSGKGGLILFEDRAIWTAPGLTAELTNLDSGATISVVIPGVFLDDLLEGDRVRTTAVGRNILFGFFDGDPGMFLTIGKVVFEWSLDDPLSFDLIEGESRGQMIDICAELAA